MHSLITFNLRSQQETLCWLHLTFLPRVQKKIIGMVVKIYLPTENTKSLEDLDDFQDEGLSVWKHWLDYAFEFTSKSKIIWSRKSKKGRRDIRHHPAFLQETRTTDWVILCYSHYCTGSKTRYRFLKICKERALAQDFISVEINPQDLLDQLLRMNQMPLNKRVAQMGACSCQELHPSRSAGRKSYGNGKISLLAFGFWDMLCFSPRER